MAGEVMSNKNRGAAAQAPTSPDIGPESPGPILQTRQRAGGEEGEETAAGHGEVREQVLRAPEEMAEASVESDRRPEHQRRVDHPFDSRLEKRGLPEPGCLLEITAGISPRIGKREKMHH